MDNDITDMGESIVYMRCVVGLPKGICRIAVSVRQSLKRTTVRLSSTLSRPRHSKEDGVMTTGMIVVVVLCGVWFLKVNCGDLINVGLGLTRGKHLGRLSRWRYRHEQGCNCCVFLPRMADVLHRQFYLWWLSNGWGPQPAALMHHPCAIVGSKKIDQ